jgi:hypothetical protein
MYRRALVGREKVLGVDHPDTLTSVNNLALVLQDLEKSLTRCKIVDPLPISTDLYRDLHIIRAAAITKAYGAQNSHLNSDQSELSAQRNESCDANSALFNSP